MYSPRLIPGIPYMNQKSSPTRNEWLETILSPFTHPSCHIPDDRTAVSGLVSSRETFSFSPTAYTGTSTTHTGGFYFFPYLSGYRGQFQETANGSGVFSGLTSNTSGVPFNQVAVPNQTSIMPDGCTVRLVSLGVRVTYEGTELNRAGKIFAGTAGINSAGIAASVVTGSNYYVDPLTVLAGSTQPSSTLIKSIMNNSVSSRVSNSILEVNWVPAGVPTYQTAPTSASGLEPNFSLTASAVLPSCMYNTASGGAGAQAGQNVLVFLIEGDVTAAASAAGNTYSVEVISHWEVIPVNPLKVAYDLTQSYSDHLAVELALNRMTVLSRYRSLGLTSNQSSMPVFRKGVGPLQKPAQFRGKGTQRRKVK